MSGFELLNKLRISKVTTPTLVLSGLSGVEDKVRALGGGADDYMTKPFHKDELLARINSIVRGPRATPKPSLKPAISSSTSTPEWRKWRDTACI